LGRSRFARRRPRRRPAKAAPSPPKGRRSSSPPSSTRAACRRFRPSSPAIRRTSRLACSYFDGERYQDAIKWYQEALRLDSKNVNASTDLGVSYYYLNQPDRALKQFEHSLSLDPRHTKTLLNQGIVRAFGKQDLAGATTSWQRVVELAPDSPEGQAAKRALDSLRSAHPGA
jgi:tetratricopeptide (TPR) repeat protein